LKDELGSKPDRIFTKFQKQICDKGCNPTIAHYDKWAKKNAVIPIIGKVMKEFGVVPPQKQTIDLAEEVAQTIKKKCASRLGGGGNLCEEPIVFSEFGNYIESNVMPAVMNYIGELMPFVAEPMCQKEKAYLEKPDLSEKVIASYLDKYARIGQKLQDLSGKSTSAPLRTLS
jgi:hypothetical protein